MFKKLMRPDKAATPKPEAEEKILSRNAHKAMEEMMSTIESLRGILLQETAALQAADNETFMLLQDRKLAAVNDYRAGMTQLMARKDEIRAVVTPALSRRLEVMQGEFHQTAEKNKENLDRMRRSFQRLGDRIMTVARDTAKKEGQFAYSASGQMHTAGKGSIGVNERA